MFCPSCGASLAEGNAFCTSCGKRIVRADPAQALTAAPGHPYAGFWLRLAAALVDGIILTIPITPIALFFFASMIAELRATSRTGAAPMALMMTMLPKILLFSVLVMLAKWLYWGLLESSRWQATVGKKMLGLYVTDFEGHRCSWAKASGRFWAGRGITIVPSLGALYYLVDCICAGLTEHKQAVHDMIAGCLVMRKP